MILRTGFYKLGSGHLSHMNCTPYPSLVRTLSDCKTASMAIDEEGVALDVVLPLLGALDYLHREVGVAFHILRSLL